MTVGVNGSFGQPIRFALSDFSALTGHAGTTASTSRTLATRSPLSRRKRPLRPRAAKPSTSFARSRCAPTRTLYDPKCPTGGPVRRGAGWRWWSRVHHSVGVVRTSCVRLLTAPPIAGASRSQRSFWLRVTESGSCSKGIVFPLCIRRSSPTPAKGWRRRRAASQR
jgi:hypothetical protein